MHCSKRVHSFWLAMARLAVVFLVFGSVVSGCICLLQPLQVKTSPVANLKIVCYSIPLFLSVKLS